MDKLITQYLHWSPYSVEITNAVDWSGGNDGAFVHEEQGSWHLSANGKPRILLDPDARHIFAVFVHEATHARHYRRNCRCYRTNNYTLREYHAYRAEVAILLRFRQKEALQYLIEILQPELYHSCPSYYVEAMTMIHKSRIWAKAVAFLESAPKVP